MTAERPLHVVVTLGTDHHPFDRLVRWVDRWAADHPDVRCVVQHGPATPPLHAEGRTMVDPTQIHDLMAGSRVVVGHAAPGTVLDARLAGRLPIVVARIRQLGEAVDDHQVTFAAWLAARAMARSVADEDSLRAHLDAALVDVAPLRLEVDPAPTPAVTLLGELIDGALAR